MYFENNLLILKKENYLEFEMEDASVEDNNEVLDAI